MGKKRNSKQRGIPANAERVTPHRPGKSTLPWASSSNHDKKKMPRIRVRLQPSMWLAGGVVAALCLVIVMTTGFKHPVTAAITPKPPETPATAISVLPQPNHWESYCASDSFMQARATRYVGRYKPEGAVLAVCDLRSGQIRALVERDSNGMRSFPRMAFASEFPAASLIKILTAAAALEWTGTTISDSLPLLGRNHTLYRFQIRPPKEKSRVPKISLEEAFARSINPVFGVLGIRVGAEPLRKMGARLGFNQTEPIPEWGVSHLIVPDTGFELAEVACGFTKSTTISPLHALEIVRSVGDDGRMIPIRLQPGRGKPDANSQPFVSPSVLTQLKTLMAATVSEGTARKGFRRNLHHEDLDRLELGGKTGSLDGPVGEEGLLRQPSRYEWYIGYARLKNNPDAGIAIAIMLINQRILAVHATELASLVVRDWERAEIHKISAAENRPRGGLAAR